MTLLASLCQYFLGVQFLIFGVNGFLNIFPNPPAPDGIIKFVQSLESTKFIMPTVKALEILSGVLVLTNLAPRWGLALLAPIIFNIIGLHLVFNFKKSWILILQVLLPYSIVLIHSRFWSWLN